MLILDSPLLLVGTRVLVGLVLRLRELLLHESKALHLTHVDFPFRDGGVRASLLCKFSAHHSHFLHHHGSSLLDVGWERRLVPAVSEGIDNLRKHLLLLMLTIVVLGRHCEVGRTLSRSEVW